MMKMYLRYEGDSGECRSVSRGKEMNREKKE